jgi:hypothetical protein
MDREIMARALECAEQHVIDGERLITQQKELIANLSDSTQARSATRSSGLSKLKVYAFNRRLSRGETCSTPRRSKAPGVAAAALRARLRQSQDDIAIALAGAAHGAEPLDIPRIEPNEIVSVRRAILLDADAGRQGGGDRLEGGGGDRDSDHERDIYRVPVRQRAGLTYSDFDAQLVGGEAEIWPGQWGRQSNSASLARVPLAKNRPCTHVVDIHRH